MSPYRQSWNTYLKPTEMWVGALFWKEQPFCMYAYRGVCMYMCMCTERERERGSENVSKNEGRRECDREIGQRERVREREKGNLYVHICVCFKSFPSKSLTSQAVHRLKGIDAIPAI